MANPIAIDQLLTHQRAELGRAEWFRGWSLALQSLVALLAAASVFSDDGGHLLGLAGVGVLVLAVWLVCDCYYRRHRSAGDQARRLLLVVYGFEEEVAELGVIQSGFTASVAKLSHLPIRDYFATVAAAGPGRAAEMIDESAFFTADIQRRSGELMLLVLFFTLVAVGLAWFAFAPQLDGGVRVITARVLLAFAVFLLRGVAGAFALLVLGGVADAVALLFLDGVACAAALPPLGVAGFLGPFSFDAGRGVAETAESSESPSPTPSATPCSPS